MAMIPIRKTKDGPWAWFSKEAVRKIRKLPSSKSRSTFACYFALVEIASDSSKDEFTTTHEWIAYKANISVRTVRYALPILKQLGLIEIDAPRFKHPNRYRLLSANCNHCSHNEESVDISSLHDCNRCITANIAYQVQILQAQITTIDPFTRKPKWLPGVTQEQKNELRSLLDQVNGKSSSP